MKKMISLFGILALAGMSASAFAQGTTSGSGSDVSGTPVTNSDVAGGTFSAPPSQGTVPVFETPQAQAAVNAAAPNVTTALSTGTITTSSGQSISQAAQTQVVTVMTSNSVSTGPAAVLATALSNAGAPAAAVQSLVESVTGLLSNPAPGQLSAAVTNLNALLDNAPASFLLKPPGEFLAIRAALSQIVAAANSTGR